MALSAYIEQKLTDAGLVDHFEDNRAQYAEMARKSYDHTRGFVEPTGLPVRVDDVIDQLEPALKISEPLKSCLADKRLSQQYWPKRFGYLILDRLWKELADHDRRAGQGPDEGAG